MTLSSFIPKPLQKLDQYLLENHPVVWSSRIHWVLFFGLIFNALCFGVSYFYTIDPREEQSSIPILLIAIFLMTFIFILSFLFYHLRFNVLKKFGNISQLGLMLHFIYYVCFFILAATPLIYPSYTQYLNTIKKYSKDELFKDVFSYNKAIAIIEYENPLIFHNPQKGQKYILLDDPKFYSDSINNNGYKICNFYINNEKQTATTNNGINGRQEFNLKHVPNFEYLDSTDYYQSIANEDDSIHILSDKTFEKIEFPDYNFIEIYYGNSKYLEKYPVKKLYEAVKDSKSEDKQKYLNQLNFIKNKYTLTDKHYDYNSYSEARDYRKIDSIYHDDFTYSFEQKYGFDDTEKHLNRIYERMDQFKYDFFDFIIYLILYFALGAAVLLWLFRTNSKKTFFFTFIYGGIIALIIILLSAVYFILMGNFDEYKINYILFYGIIPLVFGILSLKIFKDKRQLNVSIFNANIFFIMVHFIPLYILGIWINSQYLLIGKISDMEMRSNLRFQLNETISKMFIPCQIMGFVLLCAMILFYFGRLYKRWIALPEE